jgi:hypothetical protein
MPDERAGASVHDPGVQIMDRLLRKYSKDHIGIGA